MTHEASRSTPALEVKGVADTSAQGARSQADAHLRALLRYTAGFYGTAIEHGMRAGPTANAIAHVEKAARALHEIIQSWTAIAESRAALAASTPAAQVPMSEEAKPAQKRLIGWRMADYTDETSDPAMAKNWAVHVDVQPVFEGDPNTKLTGIVPPEEKSNG